MAQSYFMNHIKSASVCLLSAYCSLAIIFQCGYFLAFILIVLANNSPILLKKEFISSDAGASAHLILSDYVLM